MVLSSAVLCNRMEEFSVVVSGSELVQSALLPPKDLLIVIFFIESFP